VVHHRQGPLSPKLGALDASVARCSCYATGKAHAAADAPAAGAGQIRRDAVMSTRPGASTGVGRLNSSGSVGSPVNHVITGTAVQRALT
jgi:hypothetical protein